MRSFVFYCCTPHLNLINLYIVLVCHKNSIWYCHWGTSVRGANVIEEQVFGEQMSLGSKSLGSKSLGSKCHGSKCLGSKIRDTEGVRVRVTPHLHLYPQIPNSFANSKNNSMSTSKKR
jgi:hypothetical protein